jgi:hypothetical protein
VTHVGLRSISNVISGHANVINYDTVSLLLYCPHRLLPILLNKLSIKYLFFGELSIFVMRLTENYF